MRGLLFCVAVLGLAASAGCRESLDDDVSGDSDSADQLPVDAMISAACVEATTYSSLAMIETKIFKTSCTFSGCHNGANTDAGRLDLREGMAHAALVDTESEVAPDRKLVVASDPAASYLLLIMGHIAPEDASPPGEDPPPSVGIMPQGTGGVPLCEEKRSAIERWIQAGAAND